MLDPNPRPHRNEEVHRPAMIPRVNSRYLSLDFHKRLARGGIHRARMLREVVPATSCETVARCRGRCEVIVQAPAILMQEDFP